MKQLEGMASVYSALNEPNNEYWENNSKNKKHVKELDLFKVSQCFPLLMAANQHLDSDEFTKVLRICTVISFRYLIISGQNPNAMEKIYADTAILISSGRITRAQEVFDKLKGLYISDDEFTRNFEEKSIKTKRSAKLARYILYTIESHLSSSYKDYENDPGTLEHILPENPSVDWEIDFPVDTQESFIYRIGNFTLLEANKNKTVANGMINVKAKAYQESKYELSKKFGYQSWTPETIRLRQAYLAKQAKAVWSI
ncbi:HNH endonuclease family protein [Pantoea sp. 1B4]|uniref:HNH endonuclease family protein n=1 Tax=Pantoea sp. 1B4 TaxID=2804760 RepID=UPI001AA565A1|nr:HNH endonuclease family protein [Pantoea sp. 1B4]MBN1088965.1 HNH endonuclease [Pantoea sp. 1B4]